jgi:hypothetical protein
VKSEKLKKSDEDFGKKLKIVRLSGESWGKC